LHQFGDLFELNVKLRCQNVNKYYKHKAGMWKTHALHHVLRTKLLQWQGIYAGCTAGRLRCSQRDTTVWYVTIREQWMGL